VSNVRSATAEDRPEVVGTAVAAFVNDPALRHFFPGERYELQATAFFGYLFDKRVGHGTVWVTERCEAAALWSPPADSMSADDHQRAAEGYAAMEAMVGADAAQRLRVYNDEVDEHLPSDSAYWYLGVLATHPDHAGYRHGAAVMRAGLHNATGAAFLETTQPANVGYYQRFGWTVTASITTHTLPIWVLRNSRPESQRGMFK
jgi:ribosomal protein S18 acetylase RimI-like enzyme